MKNGNPCPKCGRNEVLYVPGGLLEGQDHAILANPLWGTVFRIARYVCVACGYSEEWVDREDDMTKARRLYENPNGNP